jgi:hypothetical protein
MPEHEARERAFYDHEHDEPRAGSRRRPVADWGVSEDVFDRLPSRRFARPERRRGESVDTHEHRRAEAAQEFEHDDVDERPTSRTIVISGPMEDFAAVEHEPELRSEPEPEPTARIETAGRRTVVIGGHPDRLPPPRRRPPRTAGERVGARPDRIVAYAFALGLLLIVIAILSANG